MTKGFVVIADNVMIAKPGTIVAIVELEDIGNYEAVKEAAMQMAQLFLHEKEKE